MQITAAILPALLLLSSAESAEWLDDVRVKISTTQNIKGMMPDFDKAAKDTKSAAKMACADRGLGKPKIEGEVTVNAIGVTPEGQRYVTLSATYACK